MYDDPILYSTIQKPRLVYKNKNRISYPFKLFMPIANEKEEKCGVE